MTGSAVVDPWGSAPLSASGATRDKVGVDKKKLNKRALSLPHTLAPVMASKPAYPPGGTWFDTLKKSFTNVTIDSTNDNAIPTSDFLEAAESLTSLFGSSVHSFNGVPF